MPPANGRRVPTMLLRATGFGHCGCALRGHSLQAPPCGIWVRAKGAPRDINHPVPGRWPVCTCVWVCGRGGFVRRAISRFAHMPMCMYIPIFRS